MGKSTVSRMFQKLSVPTLEADEVVHRLYKKGGAAVAPVGNLFPSTVVDEGIDRSILSSLVIGNAKAMSTLESVVHPLVERERQVFLEQMFAQGHDLVVFDIPLLYETHKQKSFDAVAVVSAPLTVQRQRVLSRPGMTEDKFNAILGKQMPDEEKRLLADFIIDTSCDLETTQSQVLSIIEEVSRTRVND